MAGGVITASRFPLDTLSPLAVFRGHFGIWWDSIRGTMTWF